MSSRASLSHAVACAGIAATLACTRRDHDAPAPPTSTSSSATSASAHAHPASRGSAATSRGPLAFGQRPPKPATPASPQLPMLPALAKHEKPSPPPAKPGKDSYPCGWTYSGDEHVPLVCLDERDDTKLEQTARVLVPYARLQNKKITLPRVVDHRADRTEGPARSQGRAGTCTTFGTASSIDHSVARWTGAPSHVSTMQIWARYHETKLGAALVGSVGKTLALEDVWPYDATVAWPWRDCPKTPPAKPDSSPCGQPVDAAKLAAADAKPAILIEQAEWEPVDFEVIRTKIAGGQDPVFAMYLSSHFKPVGTPGARYIADYDEKGGGHIMSLAGYAMLPASGGAGGDNYYLLHNSWGAGWGDGGFAWIHEATLAKHIQSRFGIVDARPIDAARAHRAGATCRAGEAPDSLGGACAAECADGSPRHNGVCPDLADCPAGLVNLVGECVAAAPTDASSDAASGVSWKCGPGGCAYTLPKATGGCAAEPCVVSCPAPSFRVAKDHQGLTCVE